MRWKNLKSQEEREYRRAKGNIVEPTKIRIIMSMERVLAAAVRVVAARVRAALGIALGASLEGGLPGWCTRNASRIRPRMHEAALLRGAVELSARASQLQRSSGSMHWRARFCMHDSARMTQPSGRTTDTTLTWLHVGVSHLGGPGVAETLPVK